LFNNVKFKNLDHLTLEEEKEFAEFKVWYKKRVEGKVNVPPIGNVVLIDRVFRSYSEVYNLFKSEKENKLKE
jgi:hypothetical protein